MDDYENALDKHLKEEADSVLGALARMKVSAFEPAGAILHDLQQLPPEAAAYGYYLGFTMGWWEKEPGLIVLSLMCLGCEAGARMEVSSDMLEPSKGGVKETTRIIEWNAMQRWLREVPQCGHVLAYLMMQMAGTPPPAGNIEALSMLLQQRIKALQQWGMDIMADRAWEAPMTSGSALGADDVG